MITCEVFALDCQVLGENADYTQLQNMTVSFASMFKRLSHSFKQD